MCLFSKLLKQAKKDAIWFYSNVKGESRHTAFVYGKSCLRHALSCGYITDRQFGNACIKLEAFCNAFPS